MILSFDRSERLMGKFGAAVVREVREAIPPMIYFTVVFHAVAITKAAILKNYNLSATGSAVAVVGALFVSKAILITDKRRFANVLSAGPLLYNVLWKAAIFGVFTLLFCVTEELIHLLAKYRSLGAAVQHFSAEGPWQYFWLYQMWLYGSLVMYCLVIELGHRLGARNFKELLLAPAPTVPRA
jgi:hypothetical protein